MMTADKQSQRELLLRPHPSAPQQARDFVTQTFSVWRLEDCAEPAVLIASELVTNAVRHAGTDITVRVLWTPGEVRIEVADRAGDRRPRVGQAGTGRAGGVGLVIVERLAEAWGIEEHPDGKAVWARLAVDSGDRLSRRGSG